VKPVISRKTLVLGSLVFARIAISVVLGWGIIPKT